MATITINGVSLDPEFQKPQLLALGLESLDSSQSNYILVQTEGPLTKEMRQQLNDAGAFILEYVPENTYVCHYSASNLGPVRALPFVKWVNVYMKDFKIPPELRSEQGVRSHNLLEVSAPQTSMNETPIRVNVVLHADANLEKAKEQVSVAARLSPEDLKVEGRKILVHVLPRALEDLAEIDEVRHIERVPPVKLFNDVALGILNLAPHQNGNPSLLGRSQIIAVCDTGLDTGDPAGIHAAFNGRVAKVYPLGRPQADDPNGHGTHVAGSVLGDFMSPAYGRVRGAAPAATLVFQSVLDRRGRLNGLPNDLNDLFRPPYTDDGARIHTNSWGSDARGMYDSYARQVDEFVWQHRDMLICFAAGNSGKDRDANGTVDLGSVGSPGTAKNALTIGATESIRPTESKPYGMYWPDDFPVPPLSNDGWADSPEQVAAFSSRGPCKDQRIKPDVVAPGTCILSTRSRRAEVGDFWGRSTDPALCYMGGTSMATPLVAGCAAIVREWLATAKGLPSPSAALVKALIINGARPLNSRSNHQSSTPNVHEGHGRVDMDAILSAENLWLFDEGEQLDTGEEFSTTIKVPTGSAGIKVTLVWTDPPGEALQNDLDLLVTSLDDKTRHGNQQPDSKQFDRVNNVEQITWEGMPEGNAIIVVRAHRVALHAQSFALVARAY